MTCLFDTVGNTTIQDILIVSGVEAIIYPFIYKENHENERYKVHSIIGISRSKYDKSFRYRVRWTEPFTSVCNDSWEPLSSFSAEVLEYAQAFHRLAYDYCKSRVYDGTASATDKIWMGLLQRKTVDFVGMENFCKRWSLSSKFKSISTQTEQVFNCNITTQTEHFYSISGPQQINSETSKRTVDSESIVREAPSNLNKPFQSSTEVSSSYCGSRGKENGVEEPKRIKSPTGITKRRKDALVTSEEFCCKKCPAKFGKQSILKKHVLFKHTMLPTAQCQNCHKVLMHKASLEAHLRKKICKP